MLILLLIMYLLSVYLWIYINIILFYTPNDFFLTENIIFLRFKLHKIRVGVVEKSGNYIVKYSHISPLLRRSLIYTIFIITLIFYEYK